MAISPLDAVRIEVADNDPSFYILTDDEIEYFLEKNSGSIRRTIIDACRVILFKLSQRNDETVDIFSIRGNKAAEQYRLSLELFLRDSQLNPLLSSAAGYFGGVSKADMLENDSNLDNNLVKSPREQKVQESFF